MPKKPPKLRPDVAEIAYRVMLEATGQVPKTRLPEQREKNPDAVARGSKGGRKRKDNLSPADRKAIAKNAAKQRWAHEKGTGE